MFSDNLDEFKRNYRRYKITKWSILIIYVLLQIPILTTQYIRKFTETPEDQIDSPETTKFLLYLEGIEVGLKSIKLIIDIYMFYLYMRILHFFIQFKQAKLKGHLLKFSLLNKFIIVFAFFIGVLAFYTTVIQVVYLVLLFFLPN